MVWYFIGVYNIIINRTLHSCLEIRNFSSRVEKNISLVHCTHSQNIFQHSKRNFVSPHSHVISSVYTSLHHNYLQYLLIINIYNVFFFTFSSSGVWAAFSCCSVWFKREIILPRSSWSEGTINNDHCKCPFFDQQSNPFTPEPPITTTSYVFHVWSSLLTVKDNFVCRLSNLCRRKRSFKPRQNEHDSVKGQTKRQRENHVKLTRKFTWISCSTTHRDPHLLPSNPAIKKLFPKNFPTKMKPSK